MPYNKDKNQKNTRRDKSESSSRKGDQRKSSSNKSRDEKPGYEKNERSGRPQFKGKSSSERSKFPRKSDSGKPRSERQSDSEKPRFRKKDDTRKPDFAGKAGKRPNRSKGKGRPKSGTEAKDEGIRLNRYIANAGVCSRREADTLISEGRIRVNGKVVTELGTKVGQRDKVSFDNKPLRAEKNVYILLNKPKDIITSASDDRGRKTVIDLVRSAGPERVVPVGRLDRNTTGLLLLTNDGDLTEKLTHPSHMVRKLYHVTLDKKIKDEDIEMLSKGFELEDGFIKADEVSRIEKAPNNEIGILLHSGRNRIVRRMMEHLGYKVIKLDRVLFANLTKRDLPRGRYRRLSPKEVALLKRIVGK